MEEQGNAGSAKAVELQRKMENLSFKELQEWREKLISIALGDNPSSILSTLATAHKQVQTKLVDRHAQRKRAQEKESASAMRLLQVATRTQHITCPLTCPHTCPLTCALSAPLPANPLSPVPS